MYYYYLFFSIICLILFIHIYIKLKFSFWSAQPVYHIYDFFYTKGIINENLPEINKYTNFKNIETILFSELSSVKIQRLVHLIQTNYLQNKDNIFSPTIENVTPYLCGHNDKVFVSYYNEETIIIDSKTNNSILDTKIIGMMTSRPIHIIINNGDKLASFMAYYVDYLCVDKNNRKKGIAQQLIQTHHYNQRIVNKNIVVSLFKREDELTGIIPLCVYSTYGFSVDTWHKPFELSSEYKIIEINAQNFYYLFDFIKKASKNFDIVINTEITNMIELIKTKNIFINVIIVDNIIVSAYFFRKSCVQIKKNMEVLSCFASISETNDAIFIQGFKISFWKIAAENNFGFAAIEDISYNNIIINNIKQKTKPQIISPTAYFFYNFGYPTFKSNKVLIIN